MTTTTHAKLSQQAIVTAARQIAREEGEAAISIRKVAKSLNAGTMSIYHYIESREDLLVAMLDRVALEIEYPPPHEKSEQDVIAVLSALYESFKSEPWIIDALTRYDSASVHILPFVERVFVGLERMGFRDDELDELYWVMIEYTFGKVMSERPLNKPRSKAREEEFSQAFAKHPTLSRVDSEEGFLPGSYERGLRRILGVYGR